jgi:hypothetical protein
MIISPCQDGTLILRAAIYWTALVCVVSYLIGYRIGRVSR